MKRLKVISIVLLSLGILLLLVGILFESMNWPDIWRGMTSGPIIAGLGLLLLIIYKIKKKNN